MKSFPSVFYLGQYNKRSVGEVTIVLKKIVSMTLSYLLVYSFVITYDSIMVLRTMGYEAAFTSTLGALECHPGLFSYIINWYDLSMLINSNMNPLIHFIFGKEFKRQISKRMSLVGRKISSISPYKKKGESIEMKSIVEMEGRRSVVELEGSRGARKLNTGR